MAVEEVGAVRLENVKPAVREATHGVADVVAADGDVQPAVLVYIAERRLTVVGLLILYAHLRRNVAEGIPRTLAEVKAVAEPLVARIGPTALHLRVARDQQVQEAVPVEIR
jgi:hypothetical protein